MGINNKRDKNNRQPRFALCCSLGCNYEDSHNHYKIICFYSMDSYILNYISPICKRKCQGRTNDIILDCANLDPRIERRDSCVMHATGVCVCDAPGCRRCPPEQLGKGPRSSSSSSSSSSSQARRSRRHAGKHRDA